MKTNEQLLIEARSEIKRLVRELDLFKQHARRRNTSSVAAAINDLKLAVHLNAINHGWWDGDRSNGELIALVHSELSEALEWLRNGNDKSDHIPEFLGVEEELADVVIRVLDMAGARGWDVGGAIIAKHAFNKTREYLHGGKAF